MKKQEGITIVSLIIMIVTLMILAGISVNLIIGENGILTTAKQIRQNILLMGEAESMQLNQLYYELENGGELTEDEESSKKDEIIELLQKQVEELQNQVEKLTTQNNELNKQIEELKKQIIDLQKEIEELRKQIADKNIEIESLKKQVSEKQKQIENLQNELNALISLLSQTNATADRIVAGYKAYSGGKLLTGTMINRGAVSSSLNCGGSYVIPEGYHNGQGKVVANSLESQTQATANANNVSKGVTAWVNGKKITGNGADISNAWSDGHTEGYNEAKSKAATILTQYTYGEGENNAYCISDVTYDVKNINTVTLGGMDTSYYINWAYTTVFIYIDSTCVFSGTGSPYDNEVSNNAIRNATNRSYDVSKNTTFRIVLRGLWQQRVGIKNIIFQ